MSIRLLIIIVCTLFSMVLFSQQNNFSVTLPGIVPASPEPTAFVKAGFGSSNLSTGAASVNIPLYEIKLRDYSFPISISYSTQGLKSDEYSSRVGYGWTLNATGMISRSVKGLPDELAPWMSMPSEFNQISGQNMSTDQVFNYCLNASDPSTANADCQADEYFFNVNGNSGRFVLDSNRVVHAISFTNNKIVSNGNGTFVITTQDGVKYYFGYNGANETTVTYNITGVSGVFKNQTKTAFYLTKIELPGGDYINFNYSLIDIWVSTGVTQTLTTYTTAPGGGTCRSCSELSGYTTQEDKVEYKTQYLTSINASNGISLSFNYQSRPDQSYDNRLTGVTVVGEKKYILNYYDVPKPVNTGSIIGRFFLTKLREVRLDMDVVDTVNTNNYTFTYNRLDQVPLPIIAGQDYFGYYNGGNGNILIPNLLPGENGIDLSCRNPNWNYSQIGTLSEVRYPTGGREELLYEKNSIGYFKNEKRNTYQDIFVSGSGNATSWATFTSNGIYVLKNHTATMTLNTDDAILNDGYTAPSYMNTAILNLYDGSTLVASRSVLGLSSTSTDIQLLAGHTYMLELVAKYSTERSVGTLHWDPTSSDIYDNVYHEDEIPGLRLRQIRYTDPITMSNYSKYYTYAGLDNLSVCSGSSWGVNFATQTPLRFYCGQFNQASTDCLPTVYSSSSTSSVYGMIGSGSLNYYSKVIESDDPLFKNGGTEYSFFPNEPGGNRNVIFGTDLPGISNNQIPTLAGQVQIKRVFDSSKQVIQSETYDYETLIDLTNAVPSIYVRKRWTTNSTFPNGIDAFDVIKLNYPNSWLRMKQKINTTMSNGVTMADTTVYYYASIGNSLPRATRTSDSRGRADSLTQTYPTNYAGTSVFDKMISANQIGDFVEMRWYKNGQLEKAKKNTYRDWFGDNKILQPDTVLLQSSPGDALDAEIQMEKYDSHGAVVQMRKTGDMPQTALSDTKGLLVCEVKNALEKNIAYDGFETNTEYGKWQVLSGTTNSGYEVAFTGGYSFSGTLYREGLDAGTYSVSIWTTGTPSVNGTSGTLDDSFGNWKLYKWQLSNPGSVTVQGTNMDEVRLCPVASQMVTYTYSDIRRLVAILDANAKPQYFEYDGLGRLVRVLDKSKNIIKRYDYQFTPDEDTPSSAWTPNGQIRCEPCALNSNYGSGIEQRQEIDLSPTSETYNQLRWKSVGPYGSCADNSAWANTSTSPRCVKDANGTNTGYQEQEQKDSNACSATYNQTRWIRLSSPNYTSCALPCPNCTAIDRRCINNVCEYGLMVLTSSIQLAPNSWQCTYHYEFSDGYWSSNITVNQSTMCAID